MTQYTITAHIQLALAGGMQTQKVRFTLEAKSVKEAQQKARAFLMQRTSVVIDSCDYQPTMSDVLGQFGNLFR